MESTQGVTTQLEPTSSPKEAIKPHFRERLLLVLTLTSVAFLIVIAVFSILLFQRNQSLSKEKDDLESAVKSRESTIFDLNTLNSQLESEKSKLENELNEIKNPSKPKFTYSFFSGPQGTITLINAEKISFQGDQFKAYVDTNLKDSDGCTNTKEILPGESCKLDFGECSSGSTVKIFYQDKEIFSIVC